LIRWWIGRLVDFWNPTNPPIRHLANPSSEQKRTQRTEAVDNSILMGNSSA